MTSCIRFHEHIGSDHAEQVALHLPRIAWRLPMLNINHCPAFKAEAP
jgi:hypothetical protein